MLPLSVRIGFFLAVRQIRHASLWTTSLIIGVMVLTFLNLVVVSGILVGLIQGSIDQFRAQSTGDLIISNLTDKSFIENSPNLLTLLDTIPEIDSYSARYIETGSVEANYQTKRAKDKPNIAGTAVTGIDPAREDSVTGISQFVIKGSYLGPNDFDQVLIGSYLLKEYFPVESPGLQVLDNVDVGSKVRIQVGGVLREFTVKGILKTKVDEVSRNAFLVDSQFRSMIGRTDGNVDQIAVRLKPDADPAAVRDTLIRAGADTYARVQTFEDAQPKFLKDIVATFNLLGAAFSSIGLVVASITIFIVIFINAITRRKFIGILKGIGIHGRVIEISYVFQSIFYAVIGSGIGLAMVYGLLVPYFARNPIDFPFSDGILVAPIDETVARIALLVVSTVIAGYIPAWMIIRKNTLDSILGRK
ncbi:MAG: ABC transporter permease [Candidatus Pacebacteria bacterium]|nr:ABC transporter permease [Candidatus Paceibacterota bacterium]